VIRIAAIAAGGAIGAVLRYVVSLAVHGLAGTAFPYGTLAVNVLGSGAMGFLFVMFLERFSPDGNLRALVLVGLLGAFTTFSTFSMETLNLIEEGALLKAAFNVLLSVGLCLAAAWVGVGLARNLGA